LNAMESAPTIRLLIADDHPVMRLGLVTLCHTRPDLEVCAEGANGAEAVAQYREHQPDVALLDLRMPEMDGIQAVLAVRADFPQARIIILSTFDAIEEIYQAFSAGARGYLLKQFVGDELVEGIRAVYAGQHCIPPAVAARLAERGLQSELSGREVEILRWIAKGCTNKEIAGYLSIAPLTVRNHVTHIFEKLGASDRSEAVVIALERGVLRLDQ
jgi:two-component system NarL family response regulator